ncbi:hypothetical protein J6TS2_29780 [Heyndrickxia sporothermodurans]|nr:hypothetical protein J6TS2_29780 [Heyndrickxia sporothermodurans]
MFYFNRSTFHYSLVISLFALKLKKTSPIRRSYFIIPYLSEQIILLELAPAKDYNLAVAGLHWASPSASLDKNIHLFTVILLYK